MKKDKPTREQQKLVYWLFSDFANFKSGAAVGSKVSEFQLWEAKNELKKFYIKHVKYKPSKNSLEDFLQLLEDNKGKKIEDVIEEFEKAYIKSIQDFCLNYENFSLALNLMTKDGYKKFIQYLFDYFHSNDIPFRTQIADMLRDNECDYYTFVSLKYRRCVICGNPGELHHVTNISRFGGYKHETLELLEKIEYTSLCRVCHTKAHSQPYYSKNIKGIKLDAKKLGFIMPMYKNQFKEIRKQLNELNKKQ